MKTTLSFLLATIGLCCLAAGPATARTTADTDNPTEAAHKSAARVRVADARNMATLKKSSLQVSRKKGLRKNSLLMVLLGLEENKKVTSPAKRNRQLHAYQKHLKAQVRHKAMLSHQRSVRQLNFR